MTGLALLPYPPTLIMALQSRMKLAVHSTRFSRRPTFLIFRTRQLRATLENAAEEGAHDPILAPRLLGLGDHSGDRAHSRSLGPAPVLARVEGSGCLAISAEKHAATFPTVPPRQFRGEMTR